MSKLLFLSRHYPTEAQLEMARQMGFTGIITEKTTFPSDSGELKNLIDKIKIKRKIVALSAPTWVHVAFWEKDFTTIEFVPEGELREDPDWHGIFICKGLWIYTPNSGRVMYSYQECDMDRGTQLAFMGYNIEDIGNNKN